MSNSNAKVIDQVLDQLTKRQSEHRYLDFADKYMQIQLKIFQEHSSTGIAVPFEYEQKLCGLLISQVMVEERYRNKGIFKIFFTTLIGTLNTRVEFKKYKIILFRGVRNWWLWCHLLKYKNVFMRKACLDEVVIILDDTLFQSIQDKNYKNELNIETLKSDGPTVLPPGSYHFWDI